MTDLAFSIAQLIKSNDLTLEDLAEHLNASVE